MTSRLYRIIVPLILTGVSLFSALPSYGAESCKSLFSDFRPYGDLPENAYGTMKQNFKHNADYKVEARDQSDIKNQCQLGTCHLHSWVSMLERQSIHDHENIKISTHYLSAMHWLNKSLEKLDADSDKSDIKVKLGAGVFMSRKAIMEYGLVPEQAWKGAKDFQKDPYASRIEEYIANILARTKWQAEREKDPAKKLQLIDDGKNQIRAVFKNLVGELPLTFSYEGANLTPYSFMKIYFPELTKPMVQMVVNVNRKEKTQIEPTGSYVIVKTNIDNVEKAARELLDKGFSIYAAYEHNGHFVDKKTGIMSIAAFNFPHEGAPLTREQRAYFEAGSGGHAVQIVGYDLNSKTGKVIKWKIKNSWGEASGDVGYYHMYNDYFRAYLKSITFFKDAMIKLPNDN